MGRSLSEVNNIFVIIIFPEPISWEFEIKPRDATINPQINTNIICCFLFFKRLFQLIIAVRMRPVILPPNPARYGNQNNSEENVTG